MAVAGVLCGHLKQLFRYRLLQRQSQGRHIILLDILELEAMYIICRSYVQEVVSFHSRNERETISWALNPCYLSNSFPRFSSEMSNPDRDKSSFDAGVETGKSCLTHRVLSLPLSGRPSFMPYQCI